MIEKGRELFLEEEEKVNQEVIVTNLIIKVVNK